MELSKKTKTVKSKIIICISIIATIISLLLLPNFIRVQKLKQQDYYPLYYTYIAMDKEYRMFYMLNTESVNENEVKIIIKNIIDDEFITSLRDEEIYNEFGEHSIMLYFLLPSKELPYGWQKSELNITMNFDHSAFYRNTKVLVTVPVDAKTVDDCLIEDYPHAPTTLTR